MEEMSKQKEARIIKRKNIPQRIIDTIFIVIVALLAFRLFFKLLGANPDNSFVQGIYAITEPIVRIFEGIFSAISLNGAETTAVFEPATLIAIVVIVLIAWIVQRLLSTFIVDKRSERIKHSEDKSI